jgi:hypothetical protein
MPRKRPIKQVDPNEWVTIEWTGQHEECCDCGLIHIVDYRVIDGKLQFKARRRGEKAKPTYVEGRP